MIVIYEHSCCFSQSVSDTSCRFLRFISYNLKKRAAHRCPGNNSELYQILLRRGYEVTVGRTGDKEIGFVCNKRGEKLYVQVTYLLASEETVSREFGAYDSIRDNFPKYVVSLGELDMSRNGIKHRNIRDFLLAEEWS